MRQVVPHRSLLFAGLATLLLPVLAWMDLTDGPPAPGRAPLLARAPAPAQRVAAFAPGPPEAAPGPAVATDLHACAGGTRQALELESLCAELAATRRRCEELETALSWQELVWEARLEREDLEAALRGWIAREHPDLLRDIDPVTEEPVAEEIVALLGRVAEVLAPADLEENDGRRPVPRPVTLDDVRAVVSHGGIRRLADGLPRWNLAIALAPEVEQFYSCGWPGAIRWPQLVEHALVAGVIREVRRRDLHPDDVRLALATAERRRAEEEKGRQIEAVLGLRLFEE